MGTRIILLSDGTGNSAAKVWRTNVWRVFEALDLTDPDQIACYDDGVGTSSFKPLAILGGGFGWGLKRNVIDLYKFVCRNYRSNQDEIFGFGFSRGAFTIRVVVEIPFGTWNRECISLDPRPISSIVLRQIEECARAIDPLFRIVGHGRSIRVANRRNDTRCESMDLATGAAHPNAGPQNPPSLPRSLIG